MYEMTIELSEADVKLALNCYVEKNIAQIKGCYKLVETQVRGSKFTDMTLVFKESPVQPSTEQG